MTEDNKMFYIQITNRERNVVGVDMNNEILLPPFLNKKN